MVTPLHTHCTEIPFWLHKHLNCDFFYRIWMTCDVDIPPNKGSYLHGVLLSIDGVFRPGASIFSPVEVKLHGFVCVFEVPPAHIGQMWHIYLHYRGGKKVELKKLSSFCSVSCVFKSGNEFSSRGGCCLKSLKLFGIKLCSSSSSQLC